jgi:hypothetical protein
MTDGEGAVGKLKSALNLPDIEVDISGAGGHVPTVERRISSNRDLERTCLIVFLSLLTPSGSECVVCSAYPA